MLYNSLVAVKPNNRNSLLQALESLSYFDNDFIGENGIDYAWKETIESGFDSNLEYLLDKVKDIKSDEECIIYFINKWLLNDSYYNEFEYDFLTDDNGDIIAVSLAVTTNY